VTDGNYRGHHAHQNDDLRDYFLKNRESKLNCSAYVNIAPVTNKPKLPGSGILKKEA
jgi:hypothetical protein